MLVMGASEFVAHPFLKHCSLCTVDCYISRNASEAAKEDYLKMSDNRRYKIARLIMALVFLSLAGCATNGRPSTSDAAPGDASLEEKWGVKVLSIKLSAEGHMLDFRYRVRDPEKAALLFDRGIKPYLVDDSTGAIFVVPEPPKVGALRSTRKPQTDRNYFVMFANPGRYVKKGNRITVMIGDFKAEHLVVE